MMKYKNKNKPLSERKKLYKEEVLDKVINPYQKDKFDPNTFDPMYDDTEEYHLAKRERKDPPEMLPTMGIKPKEILEGQMIGMYESKQDLYLIFAHKINKLNERVIALEKKLGKTK